MQLQFVCATMTCTAQSQRLLGGRYVPEAIYESLTGLEEAFNYLSVNKSFLLDLGFHRSWLCRPTPLHLAPLLTQRAAGAQIYLKREDIGPAGSHALSSVLAQCLLARHLQKSLVLADTGSGAHGVAVAMACQYVGLRCVVFMGAADAERQSGRVARMQQHGATVVIVTTGAGSLREASHHLFRSLAENTDIAYVIPGGPIGPCPLPRVVRQYQSLIGNEVKDQLHDKLGKLPDVLVATAGSHTPVVGLFDPFISQPEVRLVAVEGAGTGLDTPHHAAVLHKGSLGVYQGAHTLLLQDDNGQIMKCTSIAPDLCLPVTSPFLAAWKSDNRVVIDAATDEQAKHGCDLLWDTEGVRCSIEDGHAIFVAMQIASELSPDKVVVVCVTSS